MRKKSRITIRKEVGRGKGTKRPRHFFAGSIMDYVTSAVRAAAVQVVYE